MKTARIDQIKSFLMDKPNDSFLLFALAKEYEGLKNEELALATYLKLKEVDINYVGLYYHLGKLYEELEQSEKAISTYSEGIEIAKAKNDWHSLAELNNARTNAEMEL